MEKDEEKWISLPKKNRIYINMMLSISNYLLTFE